MTPKEGAVFRLPLPKEPSMATRGGEEGGVSVMKREVGTWATWLVERVLRLLSGGLPLRGVVAYTPNGVGLLLAKKEAGAGAVAVAKGEENADGEGSTSTTKSPPSRREETGAAVGLLTWGAANVGDGVMPQSGAVKGSMGRAATAATGESAGAGGGEGGAGGGGAGAAASWKSSHSCSSTTASNAAMRSVTLSLRTTGLCTGGGCWWGSATTTRGGEEEVGGAGTGFAAYCTVPVTGAGIAGGSSTAVGAAGAMRKGANWGSDTESGSRARMRPGSVGSEGSIYPCCVKAMSRRQRWKCGRYSTPRPSGSHRAQMARSCGLGRPDRDMRSTTALPCTYPCRLVPPAASWKNKSYVCRSRGGRNSGSWWEGGNAGAGAPSAAGWPTGCCCGCCGWCGCGRRSMVVERGLPELKEEEICASIQKQLQ